MIIDNYQNAELTLKKRLEWNESVYLRFSTHSQYFLGGIIVTYLEEIIFANVVWLQILYIGYAEFLRNRIIYGHLSSVNPIKIKMAKKDLLVHKNPMEEADIIPPFWHSLSLVFSAGKTGRRLLLKLYSYVNEIPAR